MFKNTTKVGQGVKMAGGKTVKQIMADNLRKQNEERRAEQKANDRKRQMEAAARWRAEQIAKGIITPAA